MTELRLMPVRRRVVARSGGTDRTKQEFKDQCDINLVVKRHAQRGIYDHVNPRTPHYGDASQRIELDQALELVAISRESFLELPALVRRAAGNDPSTFLRMLEDEEDTQLLVAAGLPLESSPAPAEPDPVPRATRETPAVEETPTPAPEAE